MDSLQSLRTRQRAQMINEVRNAALHLFAREGFDAVTVDDIVTAAGISKSTFFRIVAGKESLLIDPLLENISGIVDALVARPTTENIAEAVIAAMVDCMTVVQSADIALWYKAIQTAPHLISRVSLLSPLDRAALIRVAAERMGADADPSVDSRPGLLITVALAASEYAFRTWVIDPRSHETPLPQLVENALRTALTQGWITS